MESSHEKPRKRRDLIRDTLDEHADILIHTGDDRVDTIEAAHPDLVPAVDSLLKVTHGVYDVMTPVEPSRGFVDTLRIQLDEHCEQVAGIWEARREHSRRVTRVLSATVITLTVLAVVAAMVGSLTAIVSLLIGARHRHRPSAA